MLLSPLLLKKNHRSLGALYQKQETKSKHIFLIMPQKKGSYFLNKKLL